MFVGVSPVFYMPKFLILTKRRDLCAAAFPLFVILINSEQFLNISVRFYSFIASFVLLNTKLCFRLINFLLFRGFYLIPSAFVHFCKNLVLDIVFFF